MTITIGQLIGIILAAFAVGFSLRGLVMIDLKPIREAFRKWFEQTGLHESCEGNCWFAWQAASKEASEKQPTDTVVDLEAGAEAVYHKTFVNPKRPVKMAWKDRSKDIQENYREKAKACAKAWGLAWK